MIRVSKNLKNKKIASFILVVLVLGLPLLILAALKQQNLRSRAGGDSVQFQFSPAGGVKNSDTTFSVDVNIDAGRYSLSGIDANIFIDKDFLDFISFEPTQAFDQILNNAYDPAASILKITMVDVNAPASIGSVKLGTLTLKAKVLGSANISFVSTQAVGLGESSALAANSPINGTYAILATHQADPTPTDIPAPTPSDSPTPTPTFTPTSTPVPETKKIILNPVADSFVRSTEPNKNFGTAKNLENDSNPNEITYIKFDLSQLAGKNIKSANLKLKVSDSTNSPLILRLAGNGQWTETNINYKNRISFASTIIGFSAKIKNSVTNLNVLNTVNVKKGSNVTFSITSSGDDSGAFYSRESELSNRPQLIIEYQ